jgi:hypothetical protein
MTWPMFRNGHGGRRRRKCTDWLEKLGMSEYAQRLAQNRRFFYPPRTDRSALRFGVHSFGGVFHATLASIILERPTGVDIGGIQARVINAEGSATSDPESRSYISVRPALPRRSASSGGGSGKTFGLRPSPARMASIISPTASACGSAAMKTRCSVPGAASTASTAEFR